eukprot:3884070-Rhodomonas_salina.2
MRCPVLAWHIVLRTCYAMAGTDVVHRATKLLCGIFSLCSISCYALVVMPSTDTCARYAMSGTDVGCAATRQTRRKKCPSSNQLIPGSLVRICYAMSGTQLRYPAPTFPVVTCYDVSGTHLHSPAMICPVLTYTILL